MFVKKAKNYRNFKTQNVFDRPYGYYQWYMLKNV